MSKVSAISQSELSAASKIRLDSLSALRKDFSGPVSKDEEHFDRRVYFDPETQEEYYPYMFSKTLEHDPVTGFPKKADVEKIVQAWKYGGDKLAEVPESSVNTRKLEGIAASQSFCMMGSDSSVPTAPASFYPKIDSEGSMFEMAEVYARSLTRDVPYSDYATDSTVAAVVATLNNFADKTVAPTDGGAITNSTFGKGHSTDELVGPYVSQLLYLPYNYGNISVVQKYIVEEDYDASTDSAEWLSIQNGAVNGSTVTTDPKYAYNSRVLGSKVHNDPLYQFYYQAGLICLQNGIGPQGFSNARSSAWTSGGGPNVLASVAHVALGALRVAWAQKWGVAMAIRPEVVAQRITLAHKQSEEFIKHVPGLKNIKQCCDDKMTGILDLVAAANGSDPTNFLLKAQFPEMSPTHPSLCAGHAAVACACSTVLKAMLQTHNEDGSRKAWPVAAVHSVDGDSLIDYTDADASGMTVIGEINKLASNISLGRDAAGVHRRQDFSVGQIVGEKFAISYLCDVAKELSESENGMFEGWILEKFDGSTVKITATGVESV